MHDIIELAHNVIAGAHRLIQLLRESTAAGARHCVHLAASTDGDRAVQARNGHYRISTALLQLRDAKRVWVSCPVKSLCLDGRPGRYRSRCVGRTE